MVHNPLYAHAAGLTKGRSRELDLIKATAIIFVLLVHAVPTVMLVLAGPFLCFQAVPLFLLASAVSWSRAMAAREPSRRLGSHFTVKFLKRLFVRVFVPFFIVTACLVIYKIAQGENWQSVGFHLLKYGGYGPGCYYPWVFAQAALIFPLLWVISDMKQPKESIRLCMVFALSVGLDAILNLLQVSDKAYRLMIIRYVFLLYLGIILARGKAFSLLMLLVLGGGGLIYLTLSLYFRVRFEPVLHPAFPGAHAPAGGWSLVLALLVCWATGFVRPRPRVAKVVEMLSKASYGIFVTQMAFFWLTRPIMLRLLPTTKNLQGVVNSSIRVAVSVPICLAAGFMWYAVRSRLARNKTRVRPSSSYISPVSPNPSSPFRET